MQIKIFYFLFVMLTACGKGGSDPQPDPKLNFEDVSVAEGSGGVNNVEIKLTLDHGSSKSVSVTYSTVDGTAKSGEDFTAASNQLITFQPNETEKKIIIPVVADDIREGDETFQVRVENPVNVIQLKVTATITLKNDDTKIGFSNTGYDAPASYTGYSLTWGEEFNTNSLDPASWSYESGDGCPNLCGWGNNELQYYTNTSNNLFFQDGKMLIEAKAESFGGRSYTSARIKTQGKKAFRYGRIDIRAILPKGKGIWPALWLLPQDNVYGTWPKSGEIDMMELVGSEPAKTLGTLHYGPGPSSTFISKSYTLPSGTFNDQFHVFSLEWKEDQIQWLVDGQPYSTINKSDIGNNNYPFNEKFYLIVNLAVGGNLPGNPEAGTVFPQWIILDYIRVYQK